MKKTELINHILSENPKMDVKELENLSYESLLLIRIQIELKEEFPFLKRKNGPDLQHLKKVLAVKKLPIQVPGIWFLIRNGTYFINLVEN